MIHNQFLSPVSLFSGTSNMPSPSTQIDANRSSPAKSHVLHGVVPLSARQIARADHSRDEKYAISHDEFDFVNVVRLVELVMNKVERVTDISFTLDDGTGCIDIHRRINEPSDANEVAAIKNGIYVKVHAHLKGFRSKKHVNAFSVRPVNDFNEIVLHFIECIYVNIEINKGWATALMQPNLHPHQPFPNGMKTNNTSALHQVCYPYFDSSSQ